MPNASGLAPRRPPLTRGLKSVVEEDAAVRALMNAAYRGGLRCMIDDLQSDNPHTTDAALEAHKFMYKNAGMPYVEKAVAAGVCEALLVGYGRARDRRLRRQQQAVGPALRRIGA